MNSIKPKKVAVIHDWLTGMRGGESVLEAILECYPEADLFTLIHAPGSVSSLIENRKITTSFLNNIPGIQKYYRYFLPIMPLAVLGFNLKHYDLVLSSSHCVAKSVRTDTQKQTHVSYIHAPMRYMWDRFEDYFGKTDSLKAKITRWIALFLRPFFKSWDRRTSQSHRITTLIGNSRFIAKQIEKHYQRSPVSVIYPFCDSERFAVLNRDPQNFYLMFGAFAPYKRIDLAIEAFNQSGRSLVILGDGQDFESLKKLAKPNVQLLGYQSHSVVNDYLRTARALVFTGVEDFGIVPLEVMASGTPVIAYADGGALETVTEQTGVFFKEQTPHSLNEAIRYFEQKTPLHELKNQYEANCRLRAREFSKEQFKKQFTDLVELSSK